MSHCLSLLESSVYVGRYSWDGIKSGDREPIAWFGGAYDIVIYERPTLSGNIELLKPNVCVYSRTGIGQSISENPEKFAKNICYDFSLQIERVLWVENLLCEEDRYDIVQFTRLRTIGNTILYKTEKRRADISEILQLKDELQCFSSF